MNAFVRGATRRNIMAQFYGQVGGADNSTFSHNKKVKLIAANVADNRAFTKASVSKMSQSEFAGKKFGRTYTLYIPGKPRVINGVVADPSDIVEIETQVTLDNDNVSCELGAWQRLGDVEKFNETIAKPWATTLARSQEKKIIENEVFKAMQSVVVAKNGADYGVGFKDLSKASAKLRQLALSSEVVSFLNPDVNSAISGSGLDKFIWSDRMKDIYGDCYLGRYASAEQIEIPDLPEITAKSDASATLIIGAVKNDGDGNALGYAEVKTVTGANLFKGALFTCSALKIVDTSGIETNQPISVIVTDVNEDGTEGTISPLRISIKGKAYGNPNAWAASAGTFSLTYGLTGGSTYQICEMRTKDALAYDTYQFDQLPGSDEEMVASVGGSSVKMRIFGDGTNLNKLVRIDSAYAASIYEPRNCVVMYVEKP